MFLLTLAKKLLWTCPSSCVGLPEWRQELWTTTASPLVLKAYLLDCSLRLTVSEDPFMGLLPHSLATQSWALGAGRTRITCEPLASEKQAGTAALWVPCRHAAPFLFSGHLNHHPSSDLAGREFTGSLEPGDHSWGFLSQDLDSLSQSGTLSSLTLMRKWIC